MKRECAVVQDLLVLYEDDVLLPESRRMVEEHIKVCAECRKVYEKTSGRLPEIRGLYRAYGRVRKRRRKNRRTWR